MQKWMNWNSYKLVNLGFAKSVYPTINKWRVETMNMTAMDQNKMIHLREDAPVIYGYSPNLLPKSRDWANRPDIHVVGFWSLPIPNKPAPGQNALWERLTSFIHHAKSHRRKLIYMGFGSMEITEAQLFEYKQTAQLLSVRLNCSVIFHLGGTGKVGDGSNGEAVILPPKEDVHNFLGFLRVLFGFRAPRGPEKDILIIRGHVLHDWFMDQIDIAVHHGGAGTMFTMMKAGIPSVIRPHFGDQHLWQQVVEDQQLGTGISDVHRHLEAAVRKILSNKVYKQNMVRLRSKLQQEHAVRDFIGALGTEVERWHTDHNIQARFHDVMPVMQQYWVV